MLRTSSMHASAVCSFMVVAGVALFVGCIKSSDSTEGSSSLTAVDHDHDHAAKGPHHGELIELGKEEYHIELVHDEAKCKVTLYLLDWAAIRPVAIADKELKFHVIAADKPLEFIIPASPQADDTSGQASRFELTDEKLCQLLHDPKAKARVNVTIAGKSFSGELAAHVHDGHGHHGHQH